MSNNSDPNTDTGPPMVYQIRIRGHLGSQWKDWFEGLSITPADNGDTLLTGPVTDQAALHGLLKKVRDVGMPLLSVVQVQFEEAHPDRSKKEKKMNTHQKNTGTQDRKAVLSTLWIFLSVNYIYCDHLGIMEPEVIKGLLAGQIGAIPVTSEFLLAAAFLLEIPFAMIVLSRVLKYGANRWANIIAGILMAAVQIGTMGMGTAPGPVYLFYSAVEIACNLFIAWYAWSWRTPEG